MLRLFHIAGGNWRWTVFGNGYYNFNMIDCGARAGRRHDPRDARQPVRGHGRHALRRAWNRPGVGPWNLQIRGILRGPMWYNTEEALLAVLPGQVRNVTVYRKSPFWVWNMRGEIECRQGHQAVRGGQQHLRHQPEPDLHRPRPNPLRRQSRLPERRMRQFDARTRVHRRHARTVVMRRLLASDSGARRALWCRSSPPPASRSPCATRSIASSRCPRRRSGS